MATPVKGSAPSISGFSYVTTLNSNSGQVTPEVDSDSEFEIISLPISCSSSADSSLGTSISSVHTSLKSFVQRYPFEHGRRYHAYNAGTYPIPNDDREQDRMDLTHHVWKLVLGGELISEVVKEGLFTKRGGVQRVLDLGTGTGVWAMDFADEWVDEGVLVVGNDLSPIQPHWVPPNCTFVIDDFSRRWQYTTYESFDLIHARNLAGSISSWPGLLAEIATHLEPGGWVELQECEAKIFSDSDVELERAPMLREWMRWIKSASVLFGKGLDVVGGLEDGLREVGFVDVGKDVYEVPIGTWTHDSVLNEIGMLQRGAMIETIEPYTLALFTRVLKWSLADTQALIEMVKWELRDSELRLYCRFHFVYGRKPDV